MDKYIIIKQYSTNEIILLSSLYKTLSDQKIYYQRVNTHILMGIMLIAVANLK